MSAIGADAPAFPQPVDNDPASTVQQKRPGRDHLTVLALRVLFVGCLLGLWQLLSGGPKAVLPSTVVGSPASVATAGWHMLASGQLFASLGHTGLGVIYGLGLSIPIGAAIGALAATRIGNWLLHPIITLTYAIPKVGLISLYVILLGANTKSHVVLVTGATLFVYYFAVLQAAREIDRRTLTAMRMMGAGPLRVVRSYLLPSAAPFLFAATRIALPLAFATEIFAEIKVPSTPGLGLQLENLITALNAPGSMAVVIFVAIIGYLIDVLLSSLLSRYTRSIGKGIQI